MEIPSVSNKAVLLDQHTAMKQAINQQYKDFLADRAFEIYRQHAKLSDVEGFNALLAKDCFAAVKVFVDTIDKEVV